MTESRNSHARLDKNRLDKNRVKKKKSPTKRFKPPLLDDVLLYCNLRGNNVNAGKFIDFYTAKNWMIGKNKMKDWEAAVRTWEQNDEAYSKGTARSSGQSKFNPASADF